MEVGPFKVDAPQIQEWKGSPYEKTPEGIVAGNTFFTNSHGSQIVFYLTGGNFRQLREDMDRFSQLDTSAQWQQILARDDVQLGPHRVLRVFSTLGPAIQAQYFFEADSTTLLVVGCTFGPHESVSASRFDSLFSNFTVTAP